MKCMKEISREEEYPDIKKMIEFVQKKYEDAFKRLGKKLWQDNRSSCTI